MILITMRGGAEYTGRTVDTIIRREYGRKAYFRRSLNHASPELGEVMVPSGYQDVADHLAAVVLYIEGDER